MQLSKYINPFYKPMLPVKFQISIERDPAAYAEKWSAKITPLHPKENEPSRRQQDALNWRISLHPSASFRWTLRIYVYIACHKYQKLWTAMNEEKNSETFFHER